MRCLGTQCHGGGGWGSGGLHVGFLATARAACSPAVGLEGRGAEFIAGRQVQERGSGKAEGWPRGWQRRGRRGRGHWVEARGGVPGVTQ